MSRKSGIPPKPKGKPTGIFSSRGPQKMDPTPKPKPGVAAAKAEAYRSHRKP